MKRSDNPFRLLFIGALAEGGACAATGIRVRREATARVVVLASIIISVVRATIRVGICTCSKRKSKTRKGHSWEDESDKRCPTMKEEWRLKWLIGYLTVVASLARVWASWCVVVVSLTVCSTRHGQILVGTSSEDSGSIFRLFYETLSLSNCEPFRLEWTSLFGRILSSLDLLTSSYW
jgi:hypothetical protein